MTAGNGENKPHPRPSKPKKHPRWCEMDISGAHTRHVGSGKFHQVYIRQVPGADPYISIVDPEDTDRFNIKHLTVQQAESISFMVRYGLMTDLMCDLLLAATQLVDYHHDPDERPEYLRSLGAAPRRRSLFRRLVSAVRR
jgi:hypothetical protein